MIAFDLECSQGHTFEGWFADIASFEDQNSKGLVSCPYCNDTNVRRILSPVSFQSKDGQKEQGEDGIDYRRLAREVINYVHNNFEDVGSNFTAEALKMHYGVGEKRNIRGAATEDEEKTLKEEGVKFFKLPMPEKEDEDKS
ncbi:MAG: DUF1178 family protein [Desulfobacteraceae bacterium]